jgi:hypothetical protein
MTAPPPPRAACRCTASLPELLAWPDELPSVPAASLGLGRTAALCGRASPLHQLRYKRVGASVLLKRQCNRTIALQASRLSMNAAAADLAALGKAGPGRGRPSHAPAHPNHDRV